LVHETYIYKNIIHTARQEQAEDLGRKGQLDDGEGGGGLKRKGKVSLADNRVPYVNASLCLKPKWFRRFSLSIFCSTGYKIGWASVQQKNSLESEYLAGTLAPSFSMA
jgi:hypothetical protein